MAGADFIGIVKIGTLLTETDPEQRVTFRMVGTIKRTIAGQELKEIELRVREGTSGFPTIQENVQRIDAREFVVYRQVVRRRPGRACGALSPVARQRADRERHREQRGPRQEGAQPEPHGTHHRAQQLRPRMPTIKNLSLAVLLLLGASACHKSEPSAPTPAPAQPLTPAAKAAPAAATPSIEEPTFKLALVSGTAYSAGTPGTLELVLEARGGYHVNQDYPIKVQLKGPASVTLPKPSLGKADAAEFGEHKVRFELPFTAQPGPCTVSADVDFAVCTAETCVPDERTLALSFDVK